MKLERALQLSSEIEGWLSDAEKACLYQLAYETAPNTAIVELGAWQGKSTIMLAAGSEERSNCHVYSVDYFTTALPTDYSYASRLNGTVDYFPLFQRNIEHAGFSSTVIPIRSNTAKAGEEWGQSAVGLLFIDGDHRYKSVRGDFLAWVPHCCLQAKIAFHDYGLIEHFGVSQFVDQLVKRRIIVNIERVDSLLHADLAVTGLSEISAPLPRNGFLGKIKSWLASPFVGKT
jgi:hypothetical protein